MAEPTPEEQARIDELRASAAEAGLEGVDFQIVDPSEMPALIAAQEAAVFLKPTGFGAFKPTGVRRRHNQPVTVLPILPSIELDGPEWLREALVAGKLTCGAFGIGHEIEGETVPLFASFQFSVGENYTPVMIWIDDAPAEWVERAMERFVLVFPDEHEDGLQPWLATGPLTEFPEGVVVPPKLSRNSKCPCGSGKKFKRCHGA